MYLIYVAIGGLIIYAIDEADTFRQAAVYAESMLKCERSAGLPDQQTQHVQADRFDGEGARPDHTPIDHRSCRRGDRVKRSAHLRRNEG